MKRISSLFLSIVICISALAAHVDTVLVHSAKMNRNIEVTVLTPDGYNSNAKQQYPVVYLLNGYGGNHKDYLIVKKDLAQRASEHNVIIVTPNGNNSWYWDSPINPKSQFETFVSKELISYIDKHYNTIADRKGRAITGLSMGGHGGMWLSLRHQDVYGAGGSMSGGLDIRPFPQKWEISKSLGEYATNKAVWDSHTVNVLIPKLTECKVAIIFDCGYDDFFYEVNKVAHEEMLKKGFKHDFIIREGVHNWTYWCNSLDYQLLFFDKFFHGTLPMQESKKK